MTNFTKDETFTIQLSLKNLAHECDILAKSEQNPDQKQALIERSSTAKRVYQKIKDAVNQSDQVKMN